MSLTEEERMTQWEYKIEVTRNLQSRDYGNMSSEHLDRKRTENELNLFGEDGWELVSLQPAGVEWLAVLKRPVDQP